MTITQPSSSPATVNRPRIPDEELRQRPLAFGRLLARAGFDAWIGFGDDRAVAGPDHIRYFVDLEPHFEPVLLAGRSSASELVLLTGPETVEYAEVVTSRSCVAEILAIDELVHPEEEYPTIRVTNGADRLRDLMAGAERIAVLGHDAIPFSVWHRLIAPLKDAGHDVASGDDIAYDLRGIKTDAEQDVLDEAYSISRAGIEAAVGVIRPGVTEREIAGKIEAVMRAAGAEGFGIDTMVASGRTNTSPILARSTVKTVDAADLVTVTVAPRYEGYHGALARAFLLQPNREVEHAIEIARGGQEAALERLIVGRPGREAAEAMREALERGETGATMPYVPVHSTGLIEFEPPIFPSTSDVLIQDGMALSIDAPLFSGPWGGLRLEDGFSTRRSGTEPRFKDWRDIVPVMIG